MTLNGCNQTPKLYSYSENIGLIFYLHAAELGLHCLFSYLKRDFNKINLSVPAHHLSSFVKFFTKQNV